VTDWPTASAPKVIAFVSVVEPEIPCVVTTAGAAGAAGAVKVTVFVDTTPVKPVRLPVVARFALSARAVVANAAATSRLVRPAPSAFAATVLPPTVTDWPAASAPNVTTLLSVTIALPAVSTTVGAVGAVAPPTAPTEIATFVTLVFAVVDV
jgi:hypothetical protein